MKKKMQTFLPYQSFTRTFKCLDYKRLGKQKVEALQIINVIEGRSKGWENHPTVRMWHLNIDSLKLYCNLCIVEWVRRGYVNNIKMFELSFGLIEHPKWLGTNSFHSSHRAALLFKNYDFYSKYNWREQPKCEYVWPQ